MKQELTQKTHSKLGASSAHRWTACSGSVREIDAFNAILKGIEAKAIPQLVERYSISYESARELFNNKFKKSIYADEGTAAHEVAERCLKEGLDPFEFNGKEVEGIEVTEEMCEAVAEYLRYIEENYNPSEHRLLVETPFERTDLHPLFFGTNDACITDSVTYLEVIDLKYGKGHAVDAKDNPQLLYYALGAQKYFPFIEKIKITIVQPRAKHKEGSIRSAELTAEELKEFETWLVQKAKDTEAENAPLKQGDHCLFCPVKAVCPERRKQFGLALDEFENMGAVMNDDKSRIISFPRPEDLNMKQLAFVLKVFPSLEEYYLSVLKYATTLAEVGEQIPEHNLVEGKTHRKWIEEEKVVEALKEWCSDLTDEDIYKKSLKGLGDVSTLLAKKLKLKKTQIDPMLDEITLKPKGKYILVHESDPRPAVKFESFDNVERLEAAPKEFINIEDMFR